jgi:hypothetical protein
VREKLEIDNANPGQILEHQWTNTNLGYGPPESALIVRWLKTYAAGAQ